MSGWSIDDVNLSGLRLHNSNLSGAEFIGCRMTGAKIDGIPVQALLDAYNAAKKD